MTDKDIDKTNDNQAFDKVESTIDPAAKSLTNALTVSFSILKIIMVILVVLFVLSGVFKVESYEQAIVLRFGKIRGEPVGPGFSFGFPSPIDEVIKIPVKEAQTLAIDSLWYFQTKEEKLGGAERQPGKTLKPNIDGYCLTRNDSLVGEAGMDYNIVHSKWVLTYRIDFPERFFQEYVL